MFRQPSFISKHRRTWRSGAVEAASVEPLAIPRATEVHQDIVDPCDCVRRTRPVGVGLDQLLSGYPVPSNQQPKDKSQKNKSDMNGDVVCSPSSVTVLTCRSRPAAHDEKTSIRLTQEGRGSPVCFPPHDAPGPAEGSTMDPTGATVRDPKPTVSAHSQRLPCRFSEQPTLPQLLSAQTCLRSPHEPPMPLGNSLSHASLHGNNNGGTLHGKQRRGTRTKGMGRKATRRTEGGKNSQNRKVTDFYPIRRSSRKSKTELKWEQKKLIDDLITNGIEEGMEVQHIEGKGRAVFATRCFQKGDFIVEYHGDLLQITDAKKREAEYAQNPATGCYMYYFQYLCKTYCVDATKETGRMGRLINHSKNGNCQTKLHDINGVPHLILVASRDIDKGEEFLYDYGDRSKASIAAHPWLKY
ncbi:N-lysine methyltransferase KMT5A-A [Cyprinodon tularosa]|uniref:N-lysine methyltransferase KMT5A-A n=1 Tax=Cyprinodon tularosa TaxID=77115 RepID=UPI0018E2316D|nr:N-lysine methyltransferase KMT5A-A [Cyprinodon tularosa]